MIGPHVATTPIGEVLVHLTVTVVVFAIALLTKRWLAGRKAAGSAHPSARTARTGATHKVTTEGCTDQVLRALAGSGPGAALAKAGLEVGDTPEPIGTIAAGVARLTASTKGLIEPQAAGPRNMLSAVLVVFARHYTGREPA